MSDIHRSALVRLLYKNNETLTRQNAELRAWKEKARPYLEFAKLMKEQQKERDRSYIMLVRQYKKDIVTLTELLGGDE